MMGGGMGNMPMMGMMKDMKEMMGNMSMMHSMGMMQRMGMMGAAWAAWRPSIVSKAASLSCAPNSRSPTRRLTPGTALPTRCARMPKSSRKFALSMMPKPGDGQPASTLAARLDQQEQWLAARLDGTRAMKSAFAKLNEVLSDDQKKTANDLLTPHMGMGAMAMMPAQRSPEQKEQGRMPGMGMGSMGMGKK